MHRFSLFNLIIFLVSVKQKISTDINSLYGSVNTYVYFHCSPNVCVWGGGRGIVVLIEKLGTQKMGGEAQSFPLLCSCHTVGLTVFDFFFQILRYFWETPA